MAAVRWLGRNRVALALGLVAALPVILSVVRMIASRLSQAVPRGTSVLVESTHRTSNFNTEFDFEIGSAYVLRRHGVDVLSRNWKGIARPTTSTATVPTRSCACPSIPRRSRAPAG
jgi:hypothetical protein